MYCNDFYFIVQMFSIITDVICLKTSLMSVYNEPIAYYSQTVFDVVCDMYTRRVTT